MGLFTDVDDMATVIYVDSISGSIIDNHNQDHDDTIVYIDDTATTIYNDVDESITTVSGVFRGDVDYILYLIDNLDTNLSAVQVRRTTDFSLTTSGTDVTFDTIDLENNENALDYDDVGNQKITIGEPGLFFISYSGRCTTSGADSDIHARVMKNGSDTITSSDTTVSVSNGYITNESNDFIVILSVDDYITFQIYADHDDCSVLSDIVFTVTHMRGKQGPQGDPGVDGADGEDGLPGAGSAINILEDGMLTASGVGNLNFEGGTVSLTDDGSGHATVTVSGVDSHEHDYSDIYDYIDTVSGTISSVSGTIIDLIDTPGDYGVGKCLMSTASGTEWGFPIVYETSDEGVSSTSSIVPQQKVRLTANNVVAGKYKISWGFEWAYSSSSSEIVIDIQLDDTEYLANYRVRPAPADSSKYTCCGGFYYKTLTAGTHYVDMDWCSGSNGKTSSIRRARIDMWRVL